MKMKYALPVLLLCVTACSHLSKSGKGKNAVVYRTEVFNENITYKTLVPVEGGTFVIDSLYGWPVIWVNFIYVQMGDSISETFYRYSDETLRHLKKQGRIDGGWFLIETPWRDGKGFRCTIGPNNTGKRRWLRVDVSRGEDDLVKTSFTQPPRDSTLQPLAADTVR